MVRRVFYIVTLVLTCNLYAISAEYDSNPQQAAVWYGVVRKIPPYIINPEMKPSFYSITYYLQGDTSFNDTIYKALYRTGDEYCAGLRTSNDGMKVYIRPTDNFVRDPWWDKTKTEHLLFDFDVEIGDTISAFDASYSGIDVMGFDTSIQYRWVVTNVQITEGRKHVWVQGGQTNHMVEWIEGIGSRYILCENVYEDALYYNYSIWALCAADEEGNILYTFNTDDIGVGNKNCEWEEIEESIETLSDNTILYGKRIQNGLFIIERNGVSYTATGVRIKISP